MQTDWTGAILRPKSVALIGASDDPAQQPRQVIDGFWMGLAKRSFELA